MRSRESQAQEPQEAERGNQSKPGNQIKAVHSPQFNGHLGRVSFPSWWAQAHRALFHQLSDCQSVAKWVYLRTNITWWGAIAFFLNCSQSFTYQSFQKRRTRKWQLRGGKAKELFQNSSWDQKNAFSKMPPPKGSKSWILATSGCPSTCTKVLQIAFRSTLTRGIPKKNRKKENKTAGLRKQQTWELEMGQGRGTEGISGEL